MDMWKGSRGDVVDQDVTTSEGLAAAEKGLVQELAPITNAISTVESYKEVTIRQVAPLVLVLTCATFLNVSELLL